MSGCFGRRNDYRAIGTSGMGPRHSANSIVQKDPIFPRFFYERVCRVDIVFVSKHIRDWYRAVSALMRSDHNTRQALSDILHRMSSHIYSQLAIRFYGRRAALCIADNVNGAGFEACCLVDRAGQNVGNSA